MSSQTCHLTEVGGKGFEPSRDGGCPRFIPAWPGLPPSFVAYEIAPSQARQAGRWGSAATGGACLA